TKMEVAYFDQGRHQLDPEATVMDTVSEGSDFIDINNKRVHIITYLERFLFSPRQARSPVSTLSGGEANRLLLARLFSQPANVLVLDEPTNDLDIDTLELLEELIAEFAGTVILICHDRYFVDNVATKVWGMQGDGLVTPIVGGYAEWAAYLSRTKKEKKAAARRSGGKTNTVSDAPASRVKSSGSTTAAKPKKMSYKLRLEYDTLPGKIEAAEQKLANTQTEMAAPDFYQQDPARVKTTLTLLTEQEAVLESLMERWLELEEQVADG
ncbi:MAG: ATP-binding cassette domain-containing protein, partial [Natronospirillum sp.]